MLSYVRMILNHAWISTNQTFVLQNSHELVPPCACISFLMHSGALQRKFHIIYSSEESWEFSMRNSTEKHFHSSSRRECQNAFLRLLLNRTTDPRRKQDSWLYLHSILFNWQKMCARHLLELRKSLVLFYLSWVLLWRCSRWKTMRACYPVSHRSQCKRMNWMENFSATFKGLHEKAANSKEAFFCCCRQGDIVQGSQTFWSLNQFTKEKEDRKTFPHIKFFHLPQIFHALS